MDDLPEGIITMGEFSVYHWLIVLAIIVLLFGGRRVPELFKGLGEGIRSFKTGLSGESSTTTPSATAEAERNRKGTVNNH